MEAVVALEGVGPGSVDGLDSGPTGSFVEKRFELAQSGFVALGDEFDRAAVFAVAHPAAQPQPARPAGDEPAEADHLDITADDGVEVMLHRSV